MAMIRYDGLLRPKNSIPESDCFANDARVLKIFLKCSIEQSSLDMDKTISIQELRRAIPHHCFRPCNFRSLRFVLFDVTIAICVCTFAAITIPYFDGLLKFALWILYGYVQGLLFTGIWILAHECGHEALFSSKMANHIVGFALHSALLVPYFSWRYTHARHHRYTNHMGKDTAFVPRREEEVSSGFRLMPWLGMLEDTPVFAGCQLVIHQVLGWPAYLLFFASGASGGPETVDPCGIRSMVRSSHFDPLSDLFTASEQPYVLLSTIGVGSTLFILYQLCQSMGIARILLLYGLPYVWVNNWLVAFTYLHHNDPTVSHFEASGWTFINGALSTVDRPFGFVGRHLFHGIVDYHVVHHLFPRIPFYHAEEATNAIVPLLGSKYRRYENPFWLALWKTFRSCRSVEPTMDKPGVLQWKT